MSEIAAALLAWLVLYSYPVVAATVLVAAIGMPLPSTVVVLAAGALSADTDGDPEPVILFGLVLLAAVAGDLVSYGIGRWSGEAALERWGPRVGVTPERVAELEHRFERWGGLLVVATRCLLTGLAVPTNLVAGASGYPIRSFLGYVILGECIWAAGLTTLGWWYGASWIALLDYLEDAATALTALAVAALLAVILVRLLRSKAT